MKHPVQKRLCQWRNNLIVIYVLILQKKPDWSKGKPGDAKVKEEAEGIEA